MATERVLSNLNLISFKTESGLQNHIDELQDGDLAFTPDNSLKGTLLDFKWADHLLDDMSWLRADTFSWQSGDVYVAAYNHLVADFEGTTAETETIGNIEITYYRAEDKHKICLPDQEDKVLALYNATGVAWYYILDTANKQFKLPRSKHNKYADTLGVVGNGMTLGLTDGTNKAGLFHETFQSDHLADNIGLYGKNVGEAGISGGHLSSNVALGVTTDPEKSGIVAQQVQDTDQYKYLYFYVGNFERDAVEQTAGITTETLNGKADVDLSNMNASQSAKETIIGWGMPDYSAEVSQTWNTEYTATEDRNVMVTSGDYYGTKTYFVINGIEYTIGYMSSNAGTCTNTTNFLIKKGTVYKAYGGHSGQSIKYQPLTGVN